MSAAARHTMRTLLLLLLTLAGAVQAEPRVLRFGSYATERPAEELRKLEPFQKAVEAGLNARGFETRVEVRIYASYDEGIAAIAAGEPDFARVGPASYVMIREKSPAIQLLVVEASEGVKQFNGVIVAGPNSPVRSVGDLRGRRFAFGDAHSTTGRYLSQAALVSAGVRAPDLAGFDYLGRHDKVAFAVGAGRYDAGATNDRTLKKYGQEKGLRVIASYPSPTQAWVAKPTLEAPLVRALRDTLLGLKGDALDYIARDGFLPGSDADYDELRRVMKAARAFGG